MQQKTYMDIEAARLEDTEFKASNVMGFKVGEHIQITTKVDGSNASVAYDIETGDVISYSRTKQLDFNNTLNGFYNYVQGKTPDFKWWFEANHQDMVIFGEWNLGCNKIKNYKPEFAHNCWIVYDVYNKTISRYLSQQEVREICEDLDLTYIHVLYDGEFKSWEHVMSFLENDGYYGETQEGIVVKSADRLDSNDSREPYYVKIVSEAFKESMKHSKREKTAEEIGARENSEKIVNSIVTQRRVEKALEKLRDAGELPAQITPQDMGAVAKVLPKFVYEDCLKEEKEAVLAAGEYFGKMCGSRVMQIARSLIIS